MVQKLTDKEFLAGIGPARVNGPFLVDSHPHQATVLCIALIRCLRPHQWVKNLIVFLPLVTSHNLTNATLVTRASLAFGIFCLCASGTYVLNDLLDLDADRKHPTKRLRPFAAGELPLSWGMFLCPLLLASGVLTAMALSWSFVVVTAAYVMSTIVYSSYLKRVVLLDVFVLAGLYTLRLVAGQEATTIGYSTWLLMFSMFVFLSLALVKRYVELAQARGPNDQPLDFAARGYLTGDLAIVLTLGAGSGLIAALVLALYVNSQQVVALYSRPDLLLLICPLVLYWISRIWLLANRGRLHDDPVFFAVTDLPSYAIGTLVLGIVWLAAIH